MTHSKLLTILEANKDHTAVTTLSGMTFIFMLHKRTNQNLNARYSYDYYGASLAECAKALALASVMYYVLSCGG